MVFALQVSRCANQKGVILSLQFILQMAVHNTITSLRTVYNEEFYYYAFIFDASLHPYISAWSYEAYENLVWEIVENMLLLMWR